MLCGMIWGALLALSTSSPLPELNDRNFDQIVDKIRPTERENRWQEIPWHASLWSGVIEAQRQEKPLLIWAMDGHPLGCV
jgi:hypothetical protein